jgi:hypothetical protein
MTSKANKKNKQGRSESLGTIKADNNIDIQLEQKIDMIQGLLNQVTAGDYNIK